MYLLYVILLFLPAGLANMIPPFSHLFFPDLNYPLDFNLLFRGKRVFGDHKTIRGFISGILIGGIFFLFQKYLYTSTDFYKHLSLINYEQVSPFFGFWLGFGALGGDAIKSFFKRQMSITPGSTWFPWDQIDWVIGSLMISAFFIKVDLVLILTFLVAGLVLHLLVNGIGFIIKMNKSYI